MTIPWDMKIAALAVCLVFFTANAVASQKGKGKNQPDKGSATVSAHISVGAFAAGERDLIRRHYVTHREPLPPGLAKRGGDLPPGLEKQLRRNGHLPPGLEKKIHPFPVVLEQRLRPLRPGLIRGIIGGSAVIVDKRTSLIIDVFAVL